MPQSASWVRASLVAFSLTLIACEAPAPPKGDELRLKGGKSAYCLTDRECASDECRLGRCTERVEKVGQGGACQSSSGCRPGLYCDRQANKCAPAVRCEDVRDTMERCISEVYLTFRPGEKTKLRRLKASARKRFLERIQQILYSGLCKATQGGGLPYAQALKLLAASKKKDCQEFANELKGALNK